MMRWKSRWTAAGLVVALCLAGPVACANEADVMSRPLDGSSVEAFEAGLETVREEAGEQPHTRLKQAISYLMYYDLAVGKDQAKLYLKLDGKTPEQIIALAQQ